MTRVAQLAITRLQAILNIFVLRRKKNSKLDGKVLIDLPTKEITLQRLEFTEEEREIYDAVGLVGFEVFNADPRD